MYNPRATRTLWLKTWTLHMCVQRYESVRQWRSKDKSYQNKPLHVCGTAHLNPLLPTLFFLQAILNLAREVMKRHKKEFDRIRLEREDSEYEYVSELLRDNPSKNQCCSWQPSCYCCCDDCWRWHVTDCRNCGKLFLFFFNVSQKKSLKLLDQTVG